MKRIILYGFIGLSSLLYGYEPSVYGAGDIDSATPYGLTQTEEAVLENKKTIQMLYNKMNEQQRKIDGLTTILEGQNKEIVSLKEELEAVANKPAPVVKDNNQTYTLLLELGQMVDSINNNYVSRDELKKVLAGSRPQAESGSSLDTPRSTRSNSADIYRQGVQLFSQGSYHAAKEHFLEALAGNYKPAATNYYLGEASYYTHSYTDAISYYKQSASLNDQASYMAVLYLHTAISLDKGGERAQARAFYQHVIDNYPNTKAAAISRKRV